MFLKKFLKLMDKKPELIFCSRFLSSSSRPYDVLIVGGGVMGSSIAHHIAANTVGETFKIGVVERDPSYSTSATTLSVGGLRQQFSLQENITIGLYSHQFMLEYPTNLLSGAKDRQLLENKLPDLRFQPHGYLFLASEAGYQILKENHETQESCGATTKFLSPSQLSATFPWLNLEGIAAGCYGGDTEGWFDPWALLQAFKVSALHRGVEYIQGEVVALGGGEALDTANIETNSGESVEAKFKRVVIAAGGDSGKVAKLAGIGEGPSGSVLSKELPIEKRKRYVYVPHCPAGPGMDCPLVIDPTGVYFRREGLGGNYLCGQSPTEEQEPRDTDLDKVDMDWFDEMVWPVLAQRVPAFESLKVKSAWAGNYDYNTWDQNGVIGKHPAFSNVYMACGFSGHGIQQGPAVGRALAELVLDGKFSSIDLTRLGFERLLEDKKMLERNIV